MAEGAQLLFIERLSFWQKLSLSLHLCTDQQDDEKAIFNAKSQRCQDAEENQQIFAPLRLGIFALKVSPST